MAFLGNFNIAEDMQVKILSSLLVVVLLWIIRKIICSVMKRKVTDLAKFYHWRRVVDYTFWVLIILLVLGEWLHGIDSIAQFLGLATAGLAIAMHDTVANLAGWVFILWRKPFVVGDRIQVGDTRGDVIDIRLFQFSMIEIGNWVDAEQSTGRIVHVPNSKAFRENVANYETGFEYIWHEIPVLITFESDWQKAKNILLNISKEKAEHLSKGAAEQIRRAARKYLIHFDKLTPTVYTTVKDHGVLLTMRYIVKPRRRRNTEQDIWEEILTVFSHEKDISLAYPTTRFYNPGVDPGVSVATKNE